MESDSIQDIKNYAVVQFVSDNIFSEIIFLLPGFLKRTIQCWSPRNSANSATLIVNCAILNHNT